MGHQIGSFVGAYIGGVVYDDMHNYSNMWYGSIAMAVFAVVVNFLAAVEPMNKVRQRRQVEIESKKTII